MIKQTIVAHLVMLYNLLQGSLEVQMKINCIS